MFNGKKPDRDLQGVEMLWNKVAGGLGFEPRLAESESAVLPLDDPPIFPDMDQGDRISKSGYPICSSIAVGSSVLAKSIRPSQASSAHGQPLAGAPPICVSWRRDAVSSNSPNSRGSCMGRTNTSIDPETVRWERCQPRPRLAACRVPRQRTRSHNRACGANV